MKLAAPRAAWLVLAVVSYPFVGVAVAASDAAHPALVDSPAFTEHWYGEWVDEPSLLFNLGPLAAGEDPETPAPPLRGEYLTKFNANAQVLRDIAAGKPPPAGAGKSNPNGCPPATMPMFMFGGSYPTEIVVSPAGIYMISEFAHDTVRRIFTDGRKTPQGDELFPNHLGYSNGHWEDNTLVVATVGLLAGKTDMQAEHGSTAHITERMRMTDPNSIEDRITIEDPMAQTESWTTVRHFTREPASVQPIESDCEAGERNF